MSEPQLPKSDPELQHANILGARLTFTDEGPEGAPVLFTVHGIPGSVRDFRYLAPQISTFCRVVRVDLPGFGGSEPQHRALVSLTDRAATVVALADHLHIAKFGVIAHSMGGGTALCMAQLARDRVNALVLIAAMGLRSHRGLGQSPVVFGLMARALEVPFLRNVALPIVRGAYRKRRFPRAEVMTASEYSIQFKAFSAANFRLVNDAVRSLRPPPTLVAFTEDDHLVEPAICEELCAAIPGARSMRFKDGGHNLQKTRAVEIGSGIRDLIQVL